MPCNVSFCFYCHPSPVSCNRHPVTALNPSFRSFYSPAWFALSHLQIPVQGEIEQLQFGHRFLLQCRLRGHGQLRHGGPIPFVAVAVRDGCTIDNLNGHRSCRVIVLPGPFRATLSPLPSALLYSNHVLHR